MLAKRFLHGKITHPIIRQLEPENTGEYVMEREWDNLIILDACRYDSFVAANPFDAAVEIMESRGETTGRFIAENFSGRSSHDTLYVSANATVGAHSQYLDVFKFVGVWEQDDFQNANRQYREDIPAQRVITKAEELLETHPHKRLIAHFLPPHPPFVVRDEEPVEPGNKYRDFTAARDGAVSQEGIRQTYEENVAYILSQIKEFAHRLKGKTVITSDHGTLLGEGVRPINEVLHSRWGLRKRSYFDYGHYDYIRHPNLVTVPWLELEYDNRRKTFNGENRKSYEMEEGIIEDQLESLGYR